MIERSCAMLAYYIRKFDSDTRPDLEQFYLIYTNIEPTTCENVANSCVVCVA